MFCVEFKCKGALGAVKKINNDREKKTTSFSLFIVSNWKAMAVTLSLLSKLVMLICVVNSGTVLNEYIKFCGRHEKSKIN